MFHFYKQQNCKIPIVKRASLNIVDRKVTNDYQRPRTNLSDIVINDSRTYKPPSPRRKIRPEDINIRPRVLPDSAKGRLTNEERVQYSKEIQDAADKYAMIGEKVITKLFQAQVNDDSDVEYLNKRSKLMSTGLTKEEADNILISTFRPQRKTKKAVDLSRMDVLVPEAISIVKQLLSQKPVKINDIAQSVDITNDALLNNKITGEDVGDILNLLAANPMLRRDYKPGDPYELLGMLSNIVVDNDIVELSGDVVNKPVRSDLGEFLDPKSLKFFVDILNARKMDVKKFIEENKDNNLVVDEEVFIEGDVETYGTQTYGTQYSLEPSEEEKYQANIDEEPEEEEEKTDEGKFKDELYTVLTTSKQKGDDVYNLILKYGFDFGKYEELVNQLFDEESEDQYFADEQHKTDLITFIVTELFKEEVKKELIEAGSLANYAAIKEKYRKLITEETMDTNINFEIEKLYGTPIKKKKPEDVPVPSTPAETPLVTPAETPSVTPGQTRPSTPIPEEEKEEDIITRIKKLKAKVDAGEMLPNDVSTSDLMMMIKEYNREVTLSKYKVGGVDNLRKNNKKEYYDKLIKKLKEFEKTKDQPARVFMILDELIPAVKKCFDNNLTKKYNARNKQTLTTFKFTKPLTIEKLIKDIDNLRQEIKGATSDTVMSDDNYYKTLRCIVAAVSDALESHGTITKEEKKAITNLRRALLTTKGPIKGKITSLLESFKTLSTMFPVLKSDEPAVRPEPPKPEVGTALRPATLQTIQTPSPSSSTTGQGMKKPRGRPKKEKKPKQNRKASDWILFVKSVAKSQGLQFGEALKAASSMRTK